MINVTEKMYIYGSILIYKNIKCILINDSNYVLTTYNLEIIEPSMDFFLKEIAHLACWGLIEKICFYSYFYYSVLYNK